MSHYSPFPLEEVKEEEEEEAEEEEEEEYLCECLSLYSSLSRHQGAGRGGVESSEICCLVRFGMVR